MRNRLMFLALLFVWAMPLCAENEAAPWARAIHVDVYTAIQSVDQTSDGGFILAGVWFNDTDIDAVCIRLNASGMVQWAKKYGGTKYDYASRIMQTADGGFIFAGSTESFGAGRSDAWVVKLDSSGNIVWQKTYGSSWIEQGRVVIQNKDGSYFIAGNYQRYGTGGGWDGWCMKLTQTGGIAWRKVYRRTSDEMLMDAAATGDGGFILVGQGATRSRAWCVRIDGSGKTLWQKAYGVGDTDITATAVAATADGGAVLGGMYMTADWKANGWTAKVDSSGNLSWQSSFQSDEYVFVTAIRQEKDGHILVTGTVGFSDFIILSHGKQHPFAATPNGDSWSGRLDATGKMFWQNSFGKTPNEYLSAVHQTPDDGSVFVGYRKTSAGWDALVTRTSADGSTCSKFRSTKKISGATLNMTAESSNVGTTQGVFSVRDSKGVTTNLTTSVVNLCAATASTQ